jgi:hypothetical protein
VFAAVVACLRDEQQDAPILLRLELQQIDGVADRIEDRVAAIARL